MALVQEIFLPLSHSHMKDEMQQKLAFHVRDGRPQEDRPCLSNTRPGVKRVLDIDVSNNGQSQQQLHDQKLQNGQQQQLYHKQLGTNISRPWLLYENDTYDVFDSYSSSSSRVSQARASGSTRSSPACTGQKHQQTYDLVPFFQSGDFRTPAQQLHPRRKLSFYYHPLKKGEVRMLVLLPEQCPYARVRCRLITVRLSEISTLFHRGYPTGFSSLSYHWGMTATLDAGQEPTILLNSIEFGVTPNLLNALLHVRNGFNEVNIWVDALCIDQSSPVERAEQIYMMRYVYSLADNVYMWLGETAEDSDLAIKLLSAFGDTLSTPDKIIPDIEYAFLQLANDPDYQQHWNALCKLLRREYWFRAWIVQEVALARHAVLLCGRDRVDWNIARCFLYKYASSPILQQLPCKIPLAVQVLVELDIRRSAGRKQSLLELLMMSRERRCYDKLDKVYGTLALLDVQSPYLKVKYNEPLALVYASVVQHIVRIDKDISVLTACRRPTKEGILDLQGTASEQNYQSQAHWWPSWVPDWSCPAETGSSRSSSLLFSCSGPSYYRAAGETLLDVSFSPCNLLLCVKGISYDRVRYISSHGPLVNYETIRQDYAAVKAKLPVLHPYRNRDEFRIAFRRLWVLGRHPNGQELNPTGWDVAQWFLHLIGAADLAIKVHPFIDFMQQGRAEIKELSSTTKSFVQYPGKLFITEKGHLGRGPMCMQEGDQVCVFYGSQVPFILRQRHQSSQFQLQGECYVEGLMKGEAVTNMTVSAQSFVLH